MLWRPHPLVPATIKSMRLQLRKEYQRLVEGYREAGWGIYDDSAELNRAIALSDGYYGNSSSEHKADMRTGKKRQLTIQSKTRRTLGRQPSWSCAKTAALCGAKRLLWSTWTAQVGEYWRDRMLIMMIGIWQAL